MLRDGNNAGRFVVGVMKGDAIRFDVRCGVRALAHISERGEPDRDLCESREKYGGPPKHRRQ